MLEVIRPIPATPRIPVPVPGDIVEFAFASPRGNWYLGLVMMGGALVIIDRAISDGTGWPLFSAHSLGDTWDIASATTLKVFKHATLTIIS